jgi:hypothetical protein
MKKLITPGQMKDRDATCKLTSIHVRNETLEWVEENVTGNKQIAFNYLLLKGIEAIESTPQGWMIDTIQPEIDLLRSRAPRRDSTEGG